MSLLIATYFFNLAILPAAQHSSFWEITNPYLKDMASLNVVKAAMNSRDTAKNLEFVRRELNSVHSLLF